MSAVLATVASPPLTETAPPLMRMWPAASRLTTILLSRLAPKTDRMPAAGVKDAVTDRRMRSLRGSRPGKERKPSGLLRIGRDFCFRNRVNKDAAMRRNLRDRRCGDGRPTQG